MIISVFVIVNISKIVIHVFVGFYNSKYIKRIYAKSQVVVISLDIVDRIFSLADAQFSEQRLFAKALETTPTMVSAWRMRKSASYNKRLPQIATVLGTTVEYLLSGQESSVPSTAVRIPVLGTIPAGIPIEAIEDVLDWEEIPSSWTNREREYFGLRVKGDSMYPKYLEGDTVILRKQSTCDSGDDCAVLVNGDEATLKQILLRDGGSVELHPINPAYPPRTYTTAEVEAIPVQIIGIVVELRRKIK